MSRFVSPTVSQKAPKWTVQLAFVRLSFLFCAALVLGACASPETTAETDEWAHDASTAFASTQSWSVLGCEMPVPARFETESYEPLVARATDTSDEDYLGVLRAAPFEDFKARDDVQILAEHRYGPISAFLVRETVPGRDDGVLGLLVDGEQRQMVAAIGKVVHYIGMLAEGCAANLTK